MRISGARQLKATPKDPCASSEADYLGLTASAQNAYVSRMPDEARGRTTRATRIHIHPAEWEAFALAASNLGFVLRGQPTITSFLLALGREYCLAKCELDADTRAALERYDHIEYGGE